MRVGAGMRMHKRTWRFGLASVDSEGCARERAAVGTLASSLTGGVRMPTSMRRKCSRAPSMEVLGTAAPGKGSTGAMACA